MVRPSTCNNFAPTAWIFMNFDIWVIFEICPQCSNCIKVWPESPVVKEDRSVFMVISHWAFRRIRNIQKKICLENPNINFIFNNFCLKSYRLSDNVGKHSVQPLIPVPFQSALPYMLYCAVDSVTPVFCTKHCAVCAVPLLYHSQYNDHT